MRYLLFPLLVFALSFVFLWFWRTWANQPMAVRLGLMSLCAFGAAIVTLGITVVIVVLFD